MKKMDLTILIEKGENGFYVGQLEESPPVVSQGNKKVSTLPRHNEVDNLLCRKICKQL